MPARVCSIHGCPTIYDDSSDSRCPTHRKQAQQKHWANTRGYNTAGHRQRFRPAVLKRDPICTVCHLMQSTVADHWPLSRKELIDQHLDPDDPQHGRGLCTPCHNKATARQQPGGWNDR